MRYVSNTELVGTILNGCVADARKLLRDAGVPEHVVSKRIEFARAVARYKPAFTDAAYRISEQVAGDLYCITHDC